MWRKSGGTMTNSERLSASHNKDWTQARFGIVMIAALGLALIGLVWLSGCSVGPVRRNYLYQPSVVERGLNPKVVIEGKDTAVDKAAGIPLTDADVITLANDVELAWRK